LVDARQTGGGAKDKRPRRIFRTLGLGLITGAADDDPSAIGTYASAGAALGPSFLWTAPVTLPMMYVVVYLASKIGQVTGQGLFDVIRKHYPRWILNAALIGILLGNTIEAAADIGGMAAALNVMIPVPSRLIVICVALSVLALQIFGSYELIRDIFRWLALSLLAYAASAILAKPDVSEALRGTLMPSIRFDVKFLSLLVAVIGTTLSAYLYTWQSNQEVEEEIAQGNKKLSERRGATRAELSKSKWDILSGMFFSNMIMYFIILATAATLFKAGKTDINSAADAAEALRPLAGNAAGALFALGVVGVGFLAVPVMTAGGAYDLCQVMGWKHGLHARPSEAKAFYGVIAAITIIAVLVNFIGLNPMKALVAAGIVQGFSAPPLVLLIMLMSNNRKIMGSRVNGAFTNILGWATTVAVFAASSTLIVLWLTSPASD
jgi:NRAMP (natural resistance-associated macrophage protein)-like metal ion transporter